MKKLLLAITLAMGVGAFAQAPEMINYQGIARNATGSALISQSIGLRLTIHQTTSTGTTVYQETHNPTTNQFGLFNVQIGAGTPVSGTFSSIAWGADLYYVEVEMDENGGTSYSAMGTSQLVSVPYALYAKSSGTAGPTGPTGPAGPTGATGATGPGGADSDWTVSSNNQYSAVSGNVGIGTTTPANKLHVTGDVRTDDHFITDQVSVANSWYKAGLYNSNGTTGSAVMLFNNASGSTASDGLQMSMTTLSEISLSNRENAAMWFAVNGYGNEAMRITPAKDVGIGTNAPTALLSVNGTANKPGGGSWAVFSDARLKQNVKPYGDGLEAIKQINPVTFQYNGKAGTPTNKTYVGIIAQDMEKIAPYMVNKVIYQTPAVSKFGGSEGDDETFIPAGEKEEYLEFDPSALDFMLINAIKEQQQLIEKLQKEIEELKSK